MITRILTDGETGAAQGAWRAAKACGVQTGGWMPFGFLTEEGSNPELAHEFGANESSSSSFERRAESNVYGSDGTIYFTLGYSEDSIATTLSCVVRCRPYLVVDVTLRTALETVIDWISARQIWVLNVVGDPESKSPGIGERVEDFIIAVLYQVDQRRD